MEREKINPKKQERENAKLRKPMKPRDFDRFARSYGAIIKGGNGNHGVHVVLNTGQQLPVPRHRVLSIGVQRILVNAVRGA